MTGAREYPPAQPIEDPADPRVADFRDLMDADVRPDRRGIVIAEGVNVVERLTRSDYRVRAVFGVPGKLAELGDVLDRIDAPVYCADKWTLSDVVGFRVTRGVLASADRPVARTPESVIGDGSRFVVLETINDFENLGSIFRNAAAFGLDGVLLDARCADPLYRRSVRVSMGHVFGMPWAVLPDPWPAGLQAFKHAAVPVLAMTPRTGARSLREVATSVGDRWAVLLGAEGPGLTDPALAIADELVRIPMADGVDSLNVATAGAVAFAALAADEPR